MSRRVAERATVGVAVVVAAMLAAVLFTAAAHAASGAPLTVAAPATIDGSTQFWSVSCPRARSASPATTRDRS